MATGVSDAGRTPDLMDQLAGVARRTLAAAGPRYSPGLDPDAPNLEIRPLQQAASALTLGAGFRARAKELSRSLRAAYDRDHYLADRMFAGRRLNLHRLADDLDLAATIHSAGEVRQSVLGLRRHLKAVRQRVAAAESETYEGLRALEADKPNEDTEEAKRARSQERERFQARLSALRRLDEPLGLIGDFADGREGALLTERNSILLLGEWGTGKTHFLCDFALQALSDGAPAVVVLASSLRTDIDPLDAVAESTGLATSGAELVDKLESGRPRRNPAGVQSSSSMPSMSRIARSGAADCRASCARCRRLIIWGWSSHAAPPSTLALSLSRRATEWSS